MEEEADDDVDEESLQTDSLELSRMITSGYFSLSLDCQSLLASAPSSPIHCGMRCRSQVERREAEACRGQTPATCLTFAATTRKLVGQICENIY